MNIVTPNPRPRCQFGRPHHYMWGFYQDGTWVGDHVKCANCGQTEYEGFPEPMEERA